jgi:hypothetical protein
MRAWAPFLVELSPQCGGFRLVLLYRSHPFDIHDKIDAATGGTAPTTAGAASTAGGAASTASTVSKGAATTTGTVGRVGVLFWFSFLALPALGGVMAAAAAGRLLLVSFLPDKVAHMVNGFFLQYVPRLPRWYSIMPSVENAIN